MILRQFLHTEPIGISYLLGCGGKALGVVIDPVADVGAYLQAAEETGMRIRYVIDTHLHTDHISTGRALAKAAAAEYVLYARVNVAFPFVGVSDGDTIEVGNVNLTVLHTPGHTPEHVCLLVTDRTRASEPWLIMSGHTLMIGDLGRTELATNAEQGAKDLFRSMQKLRALPDFLEVLPGAYAGSVCGRSLSATPISTLGFEKRNNRPFWIENESEFIKFMMSDIPPAPPHAARIRATNSGRVP